MKSKQPDNEIESVNKIEPDIPFLKIMQKMRQGGKLVLDLFF